MLHLLDANVLIDANRDYYPMERIPEFWAWLAHLAGTGRIAMPREILEEVKNGRDEVAKWLKHGQPGEALLLDEHADPSLVARVVAQGYASDLNEDEIQKLGRDPFLIAAALKDTAGRRVVTTESRKPTARRANRRIPDVCDRLGVVSLDTFQLVRDLDFSTGWRP